MLNTNRVPICQECNSPLVLLTTETTTPEGSLFPQITSTYRCTNDACQDEKDKQEAKRLQQQLIRDQADQERAEAKQRDKKLNEAIALDAKS